MDRAKYIVLARAEYDKQPQRSVRAALVAHMPDYAIGELADAKRLLNTTYRMVVIFSAFILLELVLIVALAPTVIHRLINVIAF